MRWPPVQEIAPVLCPGARQFVIFHIIIDGRCFVGRPDEEPVELAAGDAVMLAQGDPHLMADRAGQEPIPVVELLPMPPWEKTPFHIHGGTGALTSSLWGVLNCADAELSPRPEERSVGTEWLRT